MRARWRLITGGVIALGLFLAWAEADMRQWSLNNDLPTGRIKDSKMFGVYEARLDVAPRDFRLNDEWFQLGEVWVEHLAEPRRTSWFSTKMIVHPDLVLCVEIVDRKGNVGLRGIEFKGAQQGRICFMAVNSTLFTEVGPTVPTEFTLKDSRGREVQFRILGREAD